MMSDDTGAMVRLPREHGRDMNPHDAGIRAAGATARGRRRINADAFLIDEPAGFLAVSDAMGDGPHAALMSRIVVAAVREPFERAWSQRPLAERFASEAAARLTRGVAMANQRAREMRRTEPRCKGATFAALVVCKNHLCVGHAGDSRIYLLRRVTCDLAQLTGDDTVMNELLSRGVPYETAAHVSNADALTRALGRSDAVDVQPFVVPWSPGDVALVCTDGLSNDVHAEAMRRILADVTDVEVSAQRLVEAAEVVGGWDNITAALVQNVGAGAAGGR
jgi:protein phosphatase